jgi:hypothetical protein
MERTRVPFARRVYSGRGTLIDEIVTEVAERPELVRLVWHARHLSDEDLDTLVGLIARSFEASTNGHSTGGNGHHPGA